MAKSTREIGKIIKPMDLANVPSRMVQSTRENIKMADSMARGVIREETEESEEAYGEMVTVFNT